MTARRWWQTVAIITAAGFVWRVAYALLSHGGDSNLVDEGDAFVYGTTAQHSVAGHWFEFPFPADRPFADHPPLTVAVLLPASAVFRSSVLAQRLTMAVVGAATVLLVAVLARSMTSRAAPGVAAGLVAAVNPNLWINDALVMSESLAGLLVAALAVTALRLARDATPRWAIVTGLLLGLAVLTRGELALLGPLLVAPLLGRRVLATATVAATAIAVVAPWTIWNLTRFDEPVLLATNDGTTLLGANCEPAYFGRGTGHWNLDCVLAATAADDGGDASQVSSRMRSSAFDFAEDNVGRWPVLLLARQGRTFGFWRPDHQVDTGVFEGRPAWASWAGYACFWLLVPVSVLGAVRLRRRRVTLVPVVATGALVVVVSAVFYGLPRFRLPLDVMTCVLAGALAGSSAAPRRRASPHPDASEIAMW